MAMAQLRQLWCAYVLWGVRLGPRDDKVAVEAGCDLVTVEHPTSGLVKLNFGGLRTRGDRPN
jgi:hypothetical protein